MYNYPLKKEGIIRLKRERHCILSAISKFSTFRIRDKYALNALVAEFAISDLSAMFWLLYNVPSRLATLGSLSAKVGINIETTKYLATFYIWNLRFLASTSVALMLVGFVKHCLQTLSIVFSKCKHYTYDPQIL